MVNEVFKIIDGNNFIVTEKGVSITEEAKTKAKKAVENMEKSGVFKTANKIVEYFEKGGK